MLQIKNILKCLLIIFFISACSESKTELIEGIYGGINLQEFLKATKVSFQVLKVVEDTHTPKTNGRSEYNFQSYEIEHYSILDAEGVLRADFYNGQLEALFFYPKDVAAFKLKMNKKYQTDFDKISKIKVNSDLLIIFSNGYSSKYAFSFFYIKLSKALDDWITHNS